MTKNINNVLILYNRYVIITFTYICTLSTENIVSSIGQENCYVD